MILKSRYNESILEFSNFINTGTDHPFIQFDIEFHHNGFNVKRPIQAEPLDLQELLEGFNNLNQNLKGSFQFEPISYEISIKFEINDSGHIDVNGWIKNDNQTLTLLFNFQTDQTFLPELISQCIKMRDLYKGFI